MADDIAKAMSFLSLVEGESGVRTEVARAAIDRVFRDEEVSDSEIALEVAEKWAARQSASLLEALASTERSPERDKARRRLNGFLARRGFRGEAMKDATARAVELARGQTS